MNVIVYYPTNKEDMLNLQKSVAMIHAQAAIGYIKKLTCPKGQKQQLITALQKGVKK